MINRPKPNLEQQSGARPNPDFAHLIKWLILIFLFLLLIFEFASGEYSRLFSVSVNSETVGISRWWSWLILLLKFTLIVTVIWLMRIQRDLKCQITEPTGCTMTEYDPAQDKVFIVVKGTAAGSIFANYILRVEDGGTPLTLPIEYPGGGASGTVPVFMGELGKLDVTFIEPSSGLTVILTVNGTSGATKVCTSTFEIQDKVAYISHIGTIPAEGVGVHPTDPSEALKLIKQTPDPAQPEASVGCSISVEGGADIYGCGREMVEYALQCREIIAGNVPWEADAPGAWTNIQTPLPFSVSDPSHPRRYFGFPGFFYPNFVLNGKLTRQWVERNILQSILPLPPTYAKRWVTVPQAWNTASATPFNGRYTVRLRVRHDNIIRPPSTPDEFYDAATVWIDNRQIVVRITALSVHGSTDLNACTELQLSMFWNGESQVAMDIKGTAWDPIILDSYPVTAPNDNFRDYKLWFKKDGGTSWQDIAVANPTTPVPNIRQTTLPPPDGDIGVLTSWDIVAALDAGPIPAGSSPPPAPYPKLYRGERCSYVIKLYARDSTWLSDTSEPHDAEFDWPFCIENDLPGNAPFPIP